MGLGFRVLGFRFGVWGLGFGGLGFGGLGLSRVLDLKGHAAGKAPFMLATRRDYIVKDS